MLAQEIAACWKMLEISSVQQLAEKLNEIDAQLSALEDEEAELRRKLAMGELGEPDSITPIEHIAIVCTQAVSKGPTCVCE